MTRHPWLRCTIHDIRLFELLVIGPLVVVTGEIRMKQKLKLHEDQVTEADDANMSEMVSVVHPTVEIDEHSE